MFDIQKLLDKWAIGEDEEFWKAIRKLYGPLVDVSLVFISCRRDHLMITITVVFYYLTIFPFHLGILTKTIKDCVWEDFGLVSLEFHYWLIFVFATVSIVLLVIKRGYFISVHRCLMKDLTQYRTGRIYDEEEPVAYEAEKSKQTIQFLFLPGLILSLAGVALLIPYLKKMDGKVHYNVHGANMKLPIVACYPFPTHEGILHILTVLGQLMAAAGMAAIVSTLDFVYFRVVQTVIFELRVLQYAVRTVNERAGSLFKKSHPKQDCSDPLLSSNPDYQECIGLCIKDCVIHHHQILHFFSDARSLVSLTAGLAILFGTGVIGLSLINIVGAMESGNYENIIIFAMLSIGEVLSILVLTYFGEAITTQGSILRDDLYFMDWTSLNLKNRKLLHGFQIGVTESMVLTGGALAPLRLDTFSQIMNTAYSFFNLVVSSK